jgi:hypothetical protein
MSPYAWEWMIRSIDLGQFPILVTVELDHRRDLKTFDIVLLFRSRDVEEPHRPITIKSVKRLSYDEAFSMPPAAALGFLRREIRTAVLHELDEWLWIGGEREDPHAYDERKP